VSLFAGHLAGSFVSIETGFLVHPIRKSAAFVDASPAFAIEESHFGTCKSISHSAGSFEILTCAFVIVFCADSMAIELADLGAGFGPAKTMTGPFGLWDGFFALSLRFALLIRPNECPAVCF
jgi:hypothetical protein